MEIRVLQNYIELAFNSKGYLYCVKNYICIGMPMLMPMPIPIPRFPNGHILNEVCYLTASVAAIQFFYGSVIISREHSKRSKCQGYCVYFTTFVAAIHIITSGLWFIRENLNGMLI